MKIQNIIICGVALLSTLTPISANAYWYYTPQTGDTWGTISEKTDTDMQLILSANGKSKWDTLYAGVPIIIPDDYAELGTGFSGGAGDYYGPSKDTYYGPVKDTPIVTEPIYYDYNGNQVVWNGTSFVPMSTAPTTTTAALVEQNWETYVPSYGDGWWSISQKTGHSVNNILRVNHATINTPLYAGVPIYLPNYEADGAPPEVVSRVIEEEQSIATTETTTIYQDTETYIGERTLYNVPYGNSWYNICLSASMLNGVTVYPGCEFSFYRYFPGHCGYSEGFKDAGAYRTGGVVAQEPGGGICFTSTTFFQCAIFVCKLKPEERHSHIRPVTYATIDVDDAAVDLWEDPNRRQDMRFTNTKDYAIRFYFTTDDNTGALTVSAYRIN